MRKVAGKIRSDKLQKRIRKKLSIRAKISGDESRPRVSVFKSNKNIFVQAIDDNAGKTLFSVQTFGKNAVGTKSDKESAKLVGAQVANLLKENKVENIVFDRNGFKYHGVIAELANSVRENGIKF